jgi:hypothetical protein
MRSQSTGASYAGCILVLWCCSCAREFVRLPSVRPEAQRLPLTELFLLAMLPYLCFFLVSFLSPQTPSFSVECQEDRILRARAVGSDLRTLCILTAILYDMRLRLKGSTAEKLCIIC